MLRIIVASTPVVGAILLPLIVPVIISRIGIGAGILSALLLSTIWFVSMLKTSEMPH